MSLMNQLSKISEVKLKDGVFINSQIREMVKVTIV